jgi:hypothetical protein
VRPVLGRVLVRRGPVPLVVARAPRFVVVVSVGV